MRSTAPMPTSKNALEFQTRLLFPVLDNTQGVSLIESAGEIVMGARHTTHKIPPQKRLNQRPPSDLTQQSRSVSAFHLQVEVTCTLVVPDAGALKKTTWLLQTIAAIGVQVRE